MVDLVVYSITSSFLVYYLVLVFQFYEKSSHFGPLQSRSKKILFLRRDSDGNVTDKYEQPVTLFEHVRRLFGVYTVEKEECVENAVFDIGCEDGEVWFVNQERMELWECPVCLSGWVSLIPVIGSLFLFHPVWSIMIWGFSAGVSSIIHTFIYGKGVEIEYVEEDEEGYGENN